MGNGIGFLLGGALQGAGAGMMEQLKQTAIERKEMALAKLKAGGGDDEFVRRMRMAGIDPASDSGKQLLQQKVVTEASPQPQFISDGQGGGRWAQPPPPTIGGSSAGSTASATDSSTFTDPDTGITYKFIGTDRKDPKAWQPIGGSTPTASSGFHVPSGNPLDPNLGR
jgi:hypothetical protein